MNYRNLVLFIRRKAVPLVLVAAFMVLGVPYLNVRTGPTAHFSGIVRSAGFIPAGRSGFTRGLSSKEVLLVDLEDGRTVQADTRGRASVVGQSVSVREYHRLLTRSIEYSLE